MRRYCFGLVDLPRVGIARFEFVLFANHLLVGKLVFMFHVGAQKLKFHFSSFQVKIENFSAPALFCESATVILPDENRQITHRGGTN
jgi:hypothetical protein